LEKSQNGYCKDSIGESCDGVGLNNGSCLWSPKGTTMSSDSILNRHADIVRLLKQGHSVRHAGKITGKGFSTVQRVKKILDQRDLAKAA
jgi:hypothetical protein